MQVRQLPPFWVGFIIGVCIGFCTVVVAAAVG